MLLMLPDGVFNTTLYQDVTYTTCGCKLRNQCTLNPAPALACSVHCSPAHSQLCLRMRSIYKKLKAVEPRELYYSSCSGALSSTYLWYDRLFVSGCKDNRLALCRAHPPTWNGSRPLLLKEGDDPMSCSEISGCWSESRG